MAAIQFRLSTAIALLLASAVIIWANVNQRFSLARELSEGSQLLQMNQGFPFSFYRSNWIGVDMDFDYLEKIQKVDPMARFEPKVGIIYGEKNSNWYPWSLLLNTLVALGVLLILSIIIEFSLRFIDRRQKTQISNRP